MGQLDGLQLTLGVTEYLWNLCIDDGITWILKELFDSLIAKSEAVNLACTQYTHVHNYSNRAIGQQHAKIRTSLDTHTYDQ